MKRSSFKLNQVFIFLKIKAEKRTDHAVQKDDLLIGKEINLETE